MRTASPGLLSLIVTTYDWPEALGVVLRALSEQDDSRFEVVVAEDGDSAETASVVRRHRTDSGFRIAHVKQPDLGWRKTRIYNRAALEAHGDYIVFLDGDCLPRRGFLHAVRRGALPGWFLCGKRLHLNEELSMRVLDGELTPWRWSTLRLLLALRSGRFTTPRETAHAGMLIPLRDRARPWRPSTRQFSPPYEGYGFFFAMSRHDFERANGFDMRYVGWGGEDEDLAARLRRMGLRCGWPGPKATLLHLWHPAQKGLMRSNKPRVEETLASSHVVAPEGLRELAAELGEAQESANRVGSSSSSSGPENR
jgi:glycosyltransferase involved in cell wall biosynthesis